jgi:GNAT superfamily N-acetyltransferase
MPDTLEITDEAAPHPISRLQRADAGRIAAFVTALDHDTLQIRFGRFMSAAAIHAHYAGLDWNGVVLLAWETGREAGLQIDGLVEVYPYPTPADARPASIEAEIALVVAPESRGRGIGRTLLSSGIATAARCGAVRSTMLLSARDHALARMAVRLGFTIDATGDRAVFAHHGDVGGR